MFDMVCRHSKCNAWEGFVLLSLDLYLSYFEWNRKHFVDFVMCSFNLDEQYRSKIVDAMNKYVETIVVEV